MCTKIWLCLSMALKEKQSKGTVYRDHLAFKLNKEILTHFYKCISVQSFVPYTECTCSSWHHGGQRGKYFSLAGEVM